MGLERLDHYTILAQDLEKTVRFYVDVLGLRDGSRPPFDFPGAWLYVDEIPVVHLVGGREAASTSTGRLDHIAFRASDFEATRTRFERTEIPFQQREVPDTNLKQLFIKDPDGVQIELNFLSENSEDAPQL